MNCFHSFYTSSERDGSLYSQLRRTYNVTRMISNDECLGDSNIIEIEEDNITVRLV